MFPTIGVGGGGYLWKLALLVGLLIVDTVVACVFDYDVGASSSAGSPLLLLLRCCNQFAVAAVCIGISSKPIRFTLGWLASLRPASTNSSSCPSFISC